MFEQDTTEAFESLIEFFRGFRALAVSPGELILPGVGIPSDPPKLADEIRLSPLRDRTNARRVVLVNRGVARRRMTFE